MVRVLCLGIGDDRGKRGRIVDESPFFLPVDVAGDTLADQFGPARRRQRREVRIGKMGEGEHCAVHQLLSCPAIAVRRTACFRTPMCRASTSLNRRIIKDVDGRDKPRHDELGHYELPINMPAMKTSIPPITTWNAAWRKGVSMNRVRIQEIAASSTMTTRIAIAVAV